MAEHTIERIRKHLPRLRVPGPNAVIYKVRMLTRMSTAFAPRESRCAQMRAEYGATGLFPALNRPDDTDERALR